MGSVESAASTSGVVHELQGEKNLFSATARICRTPAQEHCNPNGCQANHVAAAMRRIKGGCQRLSLRTGEETGSGENPNVVNVTRMFMSQKEEI